MDKISVVGAGHVGATTAQRIAEKELSRRVVLVDILEGVPQGKALDQWESAPVEGFDTMVVGAQGSEQIRMYSPESIIIMVTNPLDVMAYVAKEVTGFPRERVIGMAGVLDTARFRSFIAMELDVSVEDIQALVLGGHGDSMVPLVSSVTVGGIPLTQLLPADRIEAIVQRTRKGGGEIVGLLKTGSAYYAPSSAAVQMAEAIVRDKRRILPCAAWLQGEYGMSDVFLGVPCKLGRNGLETVYEVEMTDAEMEALAASAADVKDTMGVVHL